MANASDNQACSFFATIFAQLLARVLSTTGGAEWKIGVAEPPSATLPAIQKPVIYCLRFGGRLQGSCYVLFSQADLALLAGGERAAAAAKDPDMVAGEEALAADPERVLGERMRSLAEAIPEALAASHGQVTAVAEPADVLDPLAVHAMELKAGDAQGSSTVILLHVDPALVASLAAAGQAAPPPVNLNSSAVQANLGLVMDVELSCTLRFGQRQLSLREILDLASGSVVELDRQVDEPVELMLDGRVIARGEAVIIDGNYGLRVTQVLHTISY